MPFQHLQKHPECCIDGHEHSQQSRIAYCWCDDHRGYLTTTLMKTHNCLNKQCGAFQKLPCQYWRQLDAQKQQAARNRNKRILQQQRNELYLSLARDYLSDKPDVYITTAQLSRPGLIRITFIGKSSPGLYGLADYMKAETRCGVWLKHIHTDKDTLQTLVCNEQRTLCANDSPEK